MWESRQMELVIHLLGSALTRESGPSLWALQKWDRCYGCDTLNFPF